MEEVPKDWNSPQLESRVIQTRGTLRTQPNNTNSNDTGNGNYKNIGHDSVIMPILIMMKRKREQEEEGIREEEEGPTSLHFPDAETEVQSLAEPMGVPSLSPSSHRHRFCPGQHLPV